MNAFPGKGRGNLQTYPSSPLLLPSALPLPKYGKIIFSIDVRSSTAEKLHTWSQRHLSIQWLTASPVSHKLVFMLRLCRHVGGRITKDSSSASIVSSTNMAATSLSFESLGIDCKPFIVPDVKMRCLDWIKLFSVTLFYFAINIHSCVNLRQPQLLEMVSFSLWCEPPNFEKLVLFFCVKCQSCNRYYFSLATGQSQAFPQKCNVEKDALLSFVCLWWLVKRSSFQ